LELNKVIKKPIMLWGLEELPYDGGKIRQAKARLEKLKLALDEAYDRWEGLESIREESQKDGIKILH